MTFPNDVRKTFAEAADILEKRGRANSPDDHSCPCVVEAIYDTQSHAAGKCRDILTKVVPFETDYQWNDHPTTTDEEVLGTLRFLSDPY